MLTRRVQRLLSAGQRLALVQLYVAGTSHVQCNLQLRQRHNLLKKFSPIPIREFRKISRACHSSPSSPEDEIEEQDSRLFSENGYARQVLTTTRNASANWGRQPEPIKNVTYEEAQKIFFADWNNSKPQEILEAFKTISSYAWENFATGDEQYYKNLLSALVKNFQLFNDDEFVEIFQCFLLWQNIKHVKGKLNLIYRNSHVDLDNECLKRLPKLTTDKALLFCDYFYLLRDSKRQFVLQALRRLGNKPNRLNATNFVHWMFLVNVSRKPPVNMYELEYRMSNLLPELDIHQIGIIAMAFFKTETPIRDPQILMHIHEKLRKSLADAHDITISAIMKMTRYSAGLKELRPFFELLCDMRQYTDKFSTSCMMHIAHAAASIPYHDSILMAATIKSFENNIDKARLKDLARFTWALMTLNYDRKTPIYEKIIASLRSPTREAEVQQFEKLVPHVLQSLSVVGIFPLDLIKKYLSPEHIQRVYKNNLYKIDWDLIVLENNVRVSLPEYDGPFLEDRARQFLIQRRISSNLQQEGKLSSFDKLIVEVTHVCKSVLKSDSAIHISPVLPHFIKSDIIACLDEKNEPVSPQSILGHMSVDAIKRPPPETSHLKWIAIILAGPNLILRGSSQYNGQLASKLSQLRFIGYTPFVVTQTEWRGLKNLEEKTEYLHRLFFSTTNKKITTEDPPPLILHDKLQSIIM